MVCICVGRDGPLRAHLSGVERSKLLQWHAVSMSDKGIGSMMGGALILLQMFMRTQHFSDYL